MCEYEDLYTQINELDACMWDCYREAIQVASNEHLLDEGLADAALGEFFNQCFQNVIDDRRLHPASACMVCLTVHFGEVSGECPECGSERFYQVATFQGRGAATGFIFQDAILHIFERFFPELKVVSSKDTEFRDSCDLYIPDVAGIEVKGSPAIVSLPDGKTVELGRPGMRRTDTEKKANSNASTFKQEYPIDGVRCYVLSNALPDGWHENHSAIDGIYDVTKLEDWEELIFDLKVDRERAFREKKDVASYPPSSFSLAALSTSAANCR